jgi:hypothetical protein
MGKLKYQRLCWDVHDFKQGYQPRTNLVKDEKGVLVTDSEYFG